MELDVSQAKHAFAYVRLQFADLWQSRGHDVYHNFKKCGEINVLENATLKDIRISITGYLCEVRCCDADFPWLNSVGTIPMHGAVSMSCVLR